MLCCVSLDFSKYLDYFQCHISKVCFSYYHIGTYPVPVFESVLRIRIQSDPYINGSPGSGSVYYIRIRIQQLKNWPQIEKSWIRVFHELFSNFFEVLSKFFIFLKEFLHDLKKYYEIYRNFFEKNLETLFLCQ